MTSDLHALRSAGVLSALDVHLARALGRLGEERDERVLVAAALASRQAQQGHVCLDLRAWIETPLVALADRNADALKPILWPRLDEWLGALEASELVATPGRDRDAPLYLDKKGRLYLRRLYQQERAVTDAVSSLAEPAGLEVDEPALQAGLTRLFGPIAGAVAPPIAPAQSKPRSRNAKADAQMSLGLDAASPDKSAGVEPKASEPDLQRAAAERAVRSRLTVITGGPGTGKTHTVVKVLALLVEQAFARGRPEPPRMLLLAPTGKAVKRLSESVKKAKHDLACEERVRKAIVDEASTLHRALGVRRDTDRRGPQMELETLSADVVIVDEASMVDLALMARLLRMVPKTARLVLLGDKDQLASVEAGAVLGDVCGAGHTLSAEARARPLARCIVELTHSHRFEKDSGIRRLADAIRSGDSAATLAVLRDSSLTDVALREHVRVSEHKRAIDPELWKASVAGFAPLLREHSIDERLKILETLRVLCAHRQGPYGVVEVNRHIEQALREAGALRALAGNYSTNYAGRPILITENDRDSKLWNGDVGVLHEGEQGLRAYFPTNDSEGPRHRDVSLARLPAHESVYAMSVHKSQGSEAKHVAVVLPDAESPLLSRELLYTAVTRARESVVVYASVAAIEACVSRPVRRVSGLHDALWAP